MLLTETKTLHRYRRGHGFKSRTSLKIFFRSYFNYQFSSFLSCEDLLYSHSNSVLVPILQTFQRELGRRQANYDSVMNAGRTMINENKVEDPHKLEERLDDLRMRWEAISALSNTKQDR